MFTCPLHQWASHELPCPACQRPNVFTSTEPYIYESAPSELEAAKARVKELEEGLRGLLRFIEADGTPVDGFRFRENAVAAKQLLNQK